MEKAFGKSSKKVEKNEYKKNIKENRTKATRVTEHKFHCIVIYNTYSIKTLQHFYLELIFVLIFKLLLKYILPKIPNGYILKNFNNQIWF